LNLLNKIKKEEIKSLSIA